MVGAYGAVKSIIRPDIVADVLRETFAPKGPKIIDVNLRALAAGQHAVAGVAV